MVESFPSEHGGHEDQLGYVRIWGLLGAFLSFLSSLPSPPLPRSSLSPSFLPFLCVWV